MGRPQLEARDAGYLAPFWVSGGAANRVYHILGIVEHEVSTEIHLGNSFILTAPWSDMGQHRRFEYKPLSDFGMIEIRPGLLIPAPDDHRA